MDNYGERFDDMKRDFDIDRRISIVEKMVDMQRTKAKGAINPDIVII